MIRLIYSFSAYNMFERELLGGEWRRISGFEKPIRARVIQYCFGIY